MATYTLLDCLRLLKPPAEPYDYVAFKAQRERAVAMLHRNGWLHSGSLAGRDLRGLSFTGLDLSQADLRYVDLRGADFVKTILRYAALDGAKLVGCSLHGAELRGVSLHRADLSHTNLTNTDLHDAVFEETTLEYTLFNAARLGNTSFRNVSLRTAQQLHTVRGDIPGWLDDDTLLLNPALSPEFLQAMGWTVEEIAAFQSSARTP
jgi:hypothetical protein